ncbi:glycoside hydrolase family 32 protein [Fusobacterium sp.]|uniref:glycoside hydrolase family 32 protein n=1 Tax=Fusobacterium sp. TaxID=68766 RepID=UPI002900A74E|nr:glycoside hydrolase family 32 protein [Fusobacterium sp.]MDU1910375.1 glycoside hydrolase family 32 protein [Fusobacterium sp.]
MKFLKVEKYTYLEEKHKEYLEKLKKYVQRSKYIPKFHIYPPCGLLNDPNGLGYFRGEYQLFYQWFPFGTSHGMKHWARVTSKDMKDWKWQGAALIPNQEYEKNGCYSGNAIEKDGKFYLFYTANYKTENGRIPKQAVAVMDNEGKIEKYSNNPIIDGAPEGFTGDIRDPFVFEKNGAYYMLLGGKTVTENGELLIYKSDNLLNWNYEGILDIGIEGLGYMFECPGYIEIDGKGVLIFSPMGLKAQGDRYHNQFTSLYMIGELDLEEKKFKAGYYDEIDCGFDFYAPQVFYGKDEKPLMIGWFGCGDQQLPTDKDMWRHGLTMPRELHVKNGKLYTLPVKEITSLYMKKDLSEVTGRNILGETFVTEGIFRATEGNKILKFGTDEDNLKLKIDFSERKITLDRKNLKQAVDPAYGYERSCSFESCEELHLKIYIDNSFIEISVNNGEKMISARFFPV